MDDGGSVGGSRRPAEREFQRAGGERDGSVAGLDHCLSPGPAVWIQTGIKVSWTFLSRHCRPQTRSGGDVKFIKVIFFQLGVNGRFYTPCGPAPQSKLVFLLILLGSWNLRISAGKTYTQSNVVFWRSIFGLAWSIIRGDLNLCGIQKIEAELRLHYYWYFFIVLEKWEKVPAIWQFCQFVYVRVCAHVCVCVSLYMYVCIYVLCVCVYSIYVCVCISTTHIRLNIVVWRRLKVHRLYTWRVTKVFLEPFETPIKLLAIGLHWCFSLTWLYFVRTVIDLVNFRRTLPRRATESQRGFGDAMQHVDGGRLYEVPDIYHCCNSVLIDPTCIVPNTPNLHIKSSEFFPCYI